MALKNEFELRKWAWKNPASWEKLSKQLRREVMEIILTATVKS